MRSRAMSGDLGNGPLFRKCRRYHHWQVASLIRKSRTCLEENEEKPIPALLEQANRPWVRRRRDQKAMIWRTVALSARRSNPALTSSSRIVPLLSRSIGKRPCL
jgi:hypothetical protein